MTPAEHQRTPVRDVTALERSATVSAAVKALLAEELPALPVVSEGGRFAGIFGEREFMEALVPGYLKELSYAGFVPGTLDEVIERSSCEQELVERHMNTEHVDAGTDFSDVQLAEAFLHHRVLIIPVVDADRHVTGVVARSDFFRALAERFVDA